jgi:citrate lyase subunit beta/citryl-CoA lyase
VSRAARSYLFVPAQRPERISKAFAAAADAVIVDLEDAVAPAAKDSARDALARYLQAGRPLIVRINAIDTPWYAADAEVCRHPGVAAVMLPKAEDPTAITDLAARIEARQSIMPLIETARGVLNALAIARCERVQRLAFGPLDLQLDLGVSGDDELNAYRSQLVLVSRAAGISAPVDGPSIAIEDESAVRAEAQRARRMGFGGKLCIHPRQVPLINQSFNPSEAEVSWAERVSAAAHAAAGAAIAVDGKMVDQPVLVRAEHILQQHRSSLGKTP